MDGVWICAFQRDLRPYYKFGEKRELRLLKSHPNIRNVIIDSLFIYFSCFKICFTLTFSKSGGGLRGDAGYSDRVIDDIATYVKLDSPQY